MIIHSLSLVFGPVLRFFALRPDSLTVCIYRCQLIHDVQQKIIDVFGREIIYYVTVNRCSDKHVCMSCICSKNIRPTTY
jgi:hypothetical protein